MLLYLNACLKRLFRIVGQDRDGCLHNDGATINHKLYVVNATACYFDLRFEGLFYSVDSWKTGQKAGVNVQDTLGKGRN